MRETPTIPRFRPGRTLPPASGGGTSVASIVDELDSLLAANRAFYDAFETRNLDAMSELWSHDDDVACTHPGWSTLHGWGSVAASWFALFQGESGTQFILTDERGRLDGEIGWVTVDENLIDGATGQTVAALNLFRRAGAGWELVCHHGSAVALRPRPG